MPPILHADTCNDGGGGGSFDCDDLDGCGLDDLGDVVLTAPADGQILGFDSGDWVNLDPSALAIALDDLSDVDAPTPADGDVLTWVDADSEWQAVPPSGGGGLVDHAEIIHTGGNITLTANGQMDDVPTLGNLVLDASVGDVIGFTPNLICFGAQTFFDVATIVAAAAVNYLSDGAAGLAGGVGGWYHSVDGITNGSPVGGERKYTVQAEDIDAGTVTLQFRYHSIGSDGLINNGFSVEATNYGPVVP